MFLFCHCHSVVLWSFCYENKFLVCVNIPGNKAHSEKKPLKNIKNLTDPKLRQCVCMYVCVCVCACIYIYISGGPLSALTCCVNVRLLSGDKKNIAVNLFSKLGWELGLYYASYDDFHPDILARMYT